MEFIYVFLMIVVISSALVIKSSKKIEQMIPITTIGLILIVYLFGIFEILNIGIIAIELLEILALCYLVKKIIDAVKKKEIKSILEKIFTPGFFVYIILYIVFIVIHQNSLFTHHDEFTHWGIMIKNMWLYNSFGMGEKSFIQYSEYPPFTAVFQYIFIILKGSYSESTIISASNILYLSIIVQLLNKIEWKKNLKLLLVYIPLIVFLPMTIYIDFYKIILVDGLLGVLFFYIIYMWYIEENIKMRNIAVLFGGIALSLTKFSGLALASIAFLIILGDILIFNKKGTRKKEIKNIIIMIAITAVFVILWQIKIGITHSTKQWDMSNININALSNLFKNTESIRVIKEYIRNIFYTNVITEKNITTFSLIAIILAYVIFIERNLKLKEEKMRYRYYNICLFISCTLYMIMLLMVYLFILPKSERSMIPCFERYIGTILLAIILFQTAIPLQKNKFSKNSNIIIILLIFLAIFPVNCIKENIIQHESEETKTRVNRMSYSTILKYKDFLNEDDKIFYAANKGNDRILIGKIIRYIIMPLNIETETIYLKDANDFINTLKEENYTHVYVYKVDQEYKDKYKSVFKDEEVKEKTLYKLEEDGMLSEVEVWKK